jgi:hypothetical protein
MTFLSLGLLFFGVYTLFLSSDLLDFARASMRVFLVLVMLVCAKFSDPSSLEGVVLMFVVLQLALFAFVRLEVQVEHYRD